MSFLLEYIKHPLKIGAVAPSGKHLSKKMVKPIDFASADVIVEYGSGTGAFTKELFTHRKKNTALLLIEQNENFCCKLEQEYGKQKNVHIIHGSAENINDYLGKYGYSTTNYVVSGLPFTSLPQKISDNILTATNQAIGEEGKFITFQYSLAKRRLFEQYFHITDCLHEMRNFPPAYVIVMKNYGVTYV